MHLLQDKTFPARTAVFKWCRHITLDPEHSFSHQLFHLCKKSPKFNNSPWQANLFLTATLFARHLVLQSWGFIHLNHMAKYNYSRQLLCTFKNTENVLHCIQGTISGIVSFLTGRGWKCSSGFLDFSNAFPSPSLFFRKRVDEFYLMTFMCIF